jgi:glycosyltransferase involved in cell wall biosynthesis
MRIILIGNLPESLVNFRGPLIEQMVRLGHEVVACSPPAAQEVQVKLQALGAAYRPVPLSRAGMNPFHDLKSLFALFRLFRQERPDLVLTYTIKPIVYGSLGASLAGIPRIASIITGLGFSFSAGAGRKTLVNRLVCLLYRYGLKRNQVVFFQNPDDRQLFQTLGLVKLPSRSVLINGSGVDLERYSIAPMPKKTQFLLVARLIREKGIREYCEAAKRVKAKYPQVCFRLVGMLDKNPEAIRREEIEAWVAQGSVEFLGYLPDERPAIADTSIYVLPSFYREGTPRSTLEAMAMGRAVITTDAPGCRETVVEGRNGFLVPTQNTDALVRAMERFILEPDLIRTMGRESRRLAEDKFDVRKVNRVILENLGLLDTGKEYPAPQPVHSTMRG